MSQPLLRPLSVGEIVDVSFGLYRTHFISLVSITVLCTGLPTLLGIYLDASGGISQTSNLPLFAVMWVLILILNPLATAATVSLVSDSYVGHPVDAGSALRRALPIIAPVIGVGLLSGLLVGLGLFLLIVPGLMLVAGLSVAVPVVVLEGRTGVVDALARSWSLARGYKWKLFGLIITATVIVYVPVLILAFAVGLLGGTLIGGVDVGVLGAAVLGGLVQLLLYPFLYCVLTIAYYDLRVRKEAFDLEVLAAALQPR
jgi:hypothetical protein